VELKQGIHKAAFICLRAVLGSGGVAGSDRVDAGQASDGCCGEPQQRGAPSGFQGPARMQISPTAAAEHSGTVQRAAPLRPRLVRGLRRCVAGQRSAALEVAVRLQHAACVQRVPLPKVIRRSGASQSTMTQGSCFTLCERCGEEQRVRQCSHKPSPALPLPSCVQPQRRPSTRSTIRRALNQCHEHKHLTVRLKGAFRGMYRHRQRQASSIHTHHPRRQCGNASFTVRHLLYFVTMCIHLYHSPSRPLCSSTLKKAPFGLMMR
jgi:hypothetical protein